ncbi:RlpA-like double-psi beta-barrel-protein domain-containing protein-containing protein [Russula brevipes]|nr:RlpA-like double-psi beta-barrel-protein domain-containing protein-containing protein [Russula brevipes]
MQFFATLLIAANLVASALAVPHAIPRSANFNRHTAVARAISGTQTGQATFFEPGVGACGLTNTGSELIAAVSSNVFATFVQVYIFHFAFGLTSVRRNVCGSSITVNFQGKSVTVQATDECPGCGDTDLDLSPAAFKLLADPSLGRIQVTWNFN